MNGRDFRPWLIREAGLISWRLTPGYPTGLPFLSGRHDGSRDSAAWADVVRATGVNSYRLLPAADRDAPLDAEDLERPSRRTDLGEVSLLKAGDILHLGPLGATFLIKKTAAETEGRSFEMEWELAPETGGTPIHLHPHAMEMYEVLEGKLDVYVDGAWRTLSAGEELRVEPGAPHTFRNSSADVVRVYNTHEPAMRYDQYFEGLGRIANSGIISTQRITPKAILHLAVLMTSYEEEIISVKPPHLLMRIFGRIGRSLGYRI